MVSWRRTRASRLAAAASKRTIARRRVSRLAANGLAERGPAASGLQRGRASGLTQGGGRGCGERVVQRRASGLTARAWACVKQVGVRRANSLVGGGRAGSAGGLAAADWLVVGRETSICAGGQRRAGQQAVHNKQLAVWSWTGLSSWPCVGGAREEGKRRTNGGQRVGSASAADGRWWIVVCGERAADGGGPFKGGEPPDVALKVYYIKFILCGLYIAVCMDLVAPCHYQ